MKGFLALVLAVLMAVSTTAALAGDLGSSDSNFLFGKDQVAAASLSGSEMTQTEGKLIIITPNTPFSFGSIVIPPFPVGLLGLVVPPLIVPIAPSGFGVVGGAVNTLLGFGTTDFLLGSLLGLL